MDLVLQSLIPYAVDAWEARSDASDSWPDPSAGWEQHGSKGKARDTGIIINKSGFFFGGDPQRG